MASSIENTGSPDFLILVLQKILHRHSSCFLSKLILYESETNGNDDVVRHYDLECQGIQIINSLFNTKIRALQCRFIEELKNMAIESSKEKKEKTFLKYMSHKANKSQILSLNQGKKYSVSNQSMQSKNRRAPQTSDWQIKLSTGKTSRQNSSRLSKRRKIINLFNRLDSEISQLSAQVREYALLFPQQQEDTEAIYKAENGQDSHGRGEQNE